MDASVAAFIAYAANAVVQFADNNLTATGLAHGFVEGNPVTRFLIKHVGTVGSGAVKIGLIPFAGIIVDLTQHLSFGFNATMAAVTVVAVVWNAIQLKKRKISINIF